MPLVDVDQIRRTAIGRLVADGLLERQADIVVDHLITADVRGKPSHGMSVRFGGIVARALKGVGRVEPAIAGDRGTAVAVDGLDGFGHVGGRVCVDILIERLARLLDLG